MRSIHELTQDMEQLITDEVYHLEPHEISIFLVRMQELYIELADFHHREGPL